MSEPLQRLAFSCLLIVAVSAALLWPNRHSRHVGKSTDAVARIAIAILQHSSNSILDETYEGVLDGLAAKSYRDGEKLSVTSLNAEGDLPTGNLMAQQIAGGGGSFSEHLPNVTGIRSFPPVEERDGGGNAKSAAWYS